MIKMKQILVIKRIASLLQTDFSSDIDLQTATSDYYYASKLFETEKFLESAAIQQLFDGKLKERLQEICSKLLSRLTSRLETFIEKESDQFLKLAVIQELFPCFEYLGKQESFEQILLNGVMKATAEQIINQKNLPDILDSLTTAFNGELIWFSESISFSVKPTMTKVLVSIIGSLLVKGIFSKTEYFPINNLEVFAQNYQAYYSFVERTFKGIDTPAAIRSHMRKKQNVLYKAYVINVIKKLEGGLISLSKFVDNEKTRDSIEEFCQKKFKKTFSRAIQDFILNNVSKDTVTSSLLDRVFSLGLRTVIRVQSFFEEIYSTITQPALLEYFIWNCVQTCIEIQPLLARNIDEIAVKLQVSKEAIAKTAGLFTARLLSIRNNAIYHYFSFVSEKSLKLEDEIAGVALKLSVQLHEPEEASHLTNSIKMAFSKFLKPEMFPGLSKEDISDAVRVQLTASISRMYDKQIEDSKKTIEINKKFTLMKDQPQFRLDEFIQKQKNLDILALHSLIV